MDPSLQPLLTRLAQLSEEFRELRDGVQKAVLVAELDPEMALTRARKVLEYVVRDVYQHRINEPPGTRPLENLLQRLVKDGFFPDRLDAYANTIRKLGNVGTHTFGEKITVADVYQSLSQLSYVLEWYFEVEHPEATGQQPAPPEPATVEPPEPPAVAVPGTPVAVVPKGLRSFDAKDADFFLHLLPGPRDRDGLPESIRFWKHRVEERDEPTFTVGVIYGPSGCGKSSLVKAGLLPRLAGYLLPVYVEATADDTEARLLKGLRKRCPALPGDLDLTGTVAALGRGDGPGKGQKVFVVLDQFEQWLHARRGEEKTELATALRQCDGERVQCVVMVRDDFWLGLSRFMSDLHIELVQGQNIALVDLFDPLHARNVLAAFGRAFGRLHADLSREQESFLEQAVAGLSQDGRVISVRLALFAEMVKGKPWTPATLKEVGGTEGVGVSFLEETFGSRTAGPRHRSHQQAARAVLKALLPEQGTDIKGNMKSHGQLLEASGCSRRPQDFEELLRILDGEVRLITPTEATGVDGAASVGQDSNPVDQQTGSESCPTPPRFYQLTHDYLVPSLREWLTRKQKETRRGRAELRLTERAASWAAKPEARHLPAWWEWLNIRLLTRKKDWTASQKKMMRKATRYHVVRGLALAVMLLAVTAAGLLIRDRVVEGNQATLAAGLVRQALDAEIGQVPATVTQMDGYRRWTDPLLKQAYQEAEAAGDARKQLHASLALLPVDDGQVEYLYRRLLKAEPQDVAVIRDALQHALQPHKKDELVERLWGVVEQPPRDDEGQRLRAASALAAYDPDSPRWDGAVDSVVRQLVAVNPIVSGYWIEGLRPVKGRLLVPLSAVFRDRGEGRTAERSLATSILADYAADQADLLTDLVLDADERQFVVLFPRLEKQDEQAIPRLTAEVERKPPPKAADADREKLAKRQANAAVALLRLRQPAKAWPLLKRSPDPDDPRARSYLIHRFGPQGVDAAVLVKQLGEEPDITVRRALILSLGPEEFGDEAWTPEGKQLMVEQLQEIYRTADDPGLHAAAEWLLRQWHEEKWLAQTDEAWAKDKEWREQRQADVKERLVSRVPSAPRVLPQWYVTGQGQTMVVVPGPVEFTMGSPPTEAGRFDAEVQHRRRIGRTFALGAKAVTLGHFQSYYRSVYKQDYDSKEQYTPTDDCPVNYVNWLMAAAYCNWLSKQEGIEDTQWCFETDAKGEVTKLKENYLSLTGYRLPTEAEWEYACRAGAVTARYYGETEELLPRYGWYLKNSGERARPVGARKPNDLGLFDLYGTVYTWCQERYKDHPERKTGEIVDDIEDTLSIDTQESRVLRGGSFILQAVNVRCAYRDRYVPTFRIVNVGFRPARTFR